MESASLVRISTAEAVVNHFKERIRQGELKAGDRLPSERALQQALGISRFALREGLARLNALGIITSAQGKASTVSRDIDLTSLQNVFLPLAATDGEQYAEDLYQARILIEQETARLAAARRTPEDLQTLTELLAAMRAAGEGGGGEADVARYAEADIAFHRTIARMAGNAVLEKLFGLLAAELGPLVATSTQTRDHRQASLEWHERLYDHIRKGHGRAAATAMAEHLATCRRAYRKNRG